ncbi:MAG: hypothetical protein GPJ51_05725 [Candidatus Heimdallarchaeota archaeon]|nr:hypothetical protein [Candidatus Heimdallarchaeota archaeon]
MRELDQTILGVILAVVAVIVLVLFALFYPFRYRKKQLYYKDTVRKKFFKKSLNMKETLSYFSNNWDLSGKLVEEVDTDRSKHAEAAYIFNIEESHKLSSFSKIRLTVEDGKYIRIRASWRESIPYSIDIRAKKSNIEWYLLGIEIPVMSELYRIFTQSPNIWKKIFKDNIILERFLDVHKSIVLIFIREEYVELLVLDERVAIDLVSTVLLIEKAIRSPNLETKAIKVEKLRCYNCMDFIEPTEEYCNKCNSPRPICIICHLDLRIAEKKEIVTLPCCGVYAHRSHLNKWLKIKSQCPNCLADITDW